jgi:prepilin-type N-terminal cleavage/methylation domain-containing protein
MPTPNRARSRCRAQENQGHAPCCIHGLVMRIASPRSASAPGESGFTLIELMIVVIIISVVAVLAIPSLSSSGYDRRVFSDAASVGELVREARTRAVGRGAAQLLAITTAQATNSASFLLYESVNGTTLTGGSVAPNTPIASCDYPTVWPGATGTSTATLIDGYAFANKSGTSATLEGQGNIVARVTDPAGNIITDGNTIYLCFTPNGRVKYQTGADTTYLFNTMPYTAGAPNAVVVELTRGSFPATVYPNDTGTTDLIRAVLITPSGTTRMTSQ